MKWIICLILAAPIECLALEKCGIYLIEGRLEKSANDSDFPYILRADMNTKAEIRFLIKKSEVKLRGQDIETNVRLKLKIQNSCETECHAELMEFVMPLDPFKNPAQFHLPGLKPIKEEACRQP